MPLFEAIHVGCISVEADIWLVGEDTELYVGHKRGSLSAEHTLKNLYVEPLLHLLNKA